MNAELGGGGGGARDEKGERRDEALRKDRAGVDHGMWLKPV